ncbi:MAG: ribonucleoside-diphosphate reductase subunit alpha [Candidatus Saccharibacteria bacterium]|nr:ribonucleoside-diphosphate reductase subunit alpha [Candidatus Saccharibacteria bacterium]
MQPVSIIKRNGSREPFDINKVNAALLAASEGLDDPLSKIVQIVRELQLTLFEGMTTSQLDETLIQTAVQNIKDDPDYDTIAARLLLRTIYRDLLGEYSSDEELRQRHAAVFPDYIHHAVADRLLDPRMQDPGVFDIPRLAAELDPSKDKLSKYLGVVTNRNRYALRKQNGDPLEVPQFTNMRIAMGLSFNEANPTEAAIEFYHHMANLEYSPGGSTRVNAGGSFPQLSNCFVMEVGDDMESIAKAVRDTMFIAKGTGGIGISMNKLRAAGSPVKTTNTESTGPIPFMKMIDTALFAVSRKGKKAGAAAAYMENWHLNFPQFVDLRMNSGDPYLRTRFLDTAVFISDEFMRRVQTDEDWYLFDPAEVSDLPELYGQAFAKRYNYYIEQAEAGELRAFEKMPARQQFHKILSSLQATGHPWLTWKDTINLRALNNNTGTIHLSNLCTEITLPQDDKNIAVCNLVSINLSAFLDVETKTWDWQRLEQATRSATRQLDNLVDITTTPIPEAMNSNVQNRAIGLGFMGLADVLEKLELSYESDKAYDLVDQLAEFISYYAIDESAELAQTRGSYPNFAGSGWSKGQLPIDTLDTVSSDRQLAVAIDHTTRLDWESLRVKVKRGMRNATLMAIAPTANISHVTGTTPGIDPQFSQIFSRSTLNGKFLEVNTNLVNKLKQLGLWEDLKDELLTTQGDIQHMEQIPQAVRNVYKTSFQLSPYAFIEVAARAQKWVDQAISRNMYLESRNIDEYITIYSEAWRRGLKTTYYLHVKPRHQSEQVSIRANKTEQKLHQDAKRVGFGGFYRARKKQEEGKEKES